MSPDARRERAIRARLTLEDGVVTAVLAEVRVELHAEWERARFSRTREQLHAELRALDRVVQRLATMAGQAPR